MKCLVTGGAGFIGSHLVDKLIELGHNVSVIDNLSTGDAKNLNPKAKFYKLDVLDKKVSKVFAEVRPEAVFHYAAQINVRKSVEDPILDAQINILGGLNILENCKDYKIKKIIFSSSGGTIYGRAKAIPTNESSPELPISPYGVAKLTVEKYLNYYYDVFGLRFVVLRLANVYGPRQNPKGEAGVVAIFSDKMLANVQPIINGKGDQTRDYVFVEDVVKANILAMEDNIVGVFNVGTGVETDVNAIFKRINILTGAGFKEIHGPSSQGELERSCLDFSKINKFLGWQPQYNIEEGLKKTVARFKENIKSKNHGKKK